MIKDTDKLKPGCNPTGLTNMQDGRQSVFVSLLVETLFYSKSFKYFFGWEKCEGKLDLNLFLNVKVNTLQKMKET